MSEDTIEHETLAAALVAVMDDLPGIEKVRHEGGVSYKYRGIEEITVALQPILVRHGVVITPSAEVVSVVPLPEKGNANNWTRTTLSVAYTIHHAGSDQEFYATCIGVGDDNADKGANKAMTQAFKYLLLQTFCVSDPSEDGDGIPVTQNGQPVQAAEPEPVAPEGWGTAKESAAAHTALSERVSKLSDEQRAVCSEWRKTNPGWPLAKEKFDELSVIVGLLESGDAEPVGTGPADPAAEAGSDAAPGDGF